MRSSAFESVIVIDLVLCKGLKLIYRLNKVLRTCSGNFEVGFGRLVWLWLCLSLIYNQTRQNNMRMFQ